MKPTYRKSWAGNLLMLSDFTFGPTSKVKRWFTGFSELSFQWIQICIGSPMRRSSYICLSFKQYVRKIGFVFCVQVYEIHIKLKRQI